MNIDQILQNSSSNSYLNDDYKSSNSPEQYIREDKEISEDVIQKSFTVEAEKAFNNAEAARGRENQQDHDMQTNLKTNSESATNSGREEIMNQPMQVH